MRFFQRHQLTLVASAILGLAIGNFQSVSALAQSVPTTRDKWLWPNGTEIN